MHLFLTLKKNIWINPHPTSHLTEMETNILFIRKQMYFFEKYRLICYFTLNTFTMDCSNYLRPDKCQKIGHKLAVQLCRRWVVWTGLWSWTPHTGIRMWKFYSIHLCFQILSTVTTGLTLLSNFKVHTPTKWWHSESGACACFSLI